MSETRLSSEEELYCELDRLRAEIAKYEAAGKGLLPDCEPVSGAGVCAAFQLARAALGHVAAAKDGIIANLNERSAQYERDNAAKDARIALLEAAFNKATDRAEQFQSRVSELNDEALVKDARIGILEKDVMTFCEAIAHAERAEAQRDALREALEPFARMWSPSDGRGYHTRSIPSDKFEKARAALNPSPAGREG